MLEGFNRHGPNTDTLSTSGTVLVIDTLTDNPATGKGIIINAYYGYNSNAGAQHGLIIDGMAYLVGANYTGSLATAKFPIFVKPGIEVSLYQSAASGQCGINWQSRG